MQPARPAASALTPVQTHNQHVLSSWLAGAMLTVDRLQRTECRDEQLGVVWMRANRLNYQLVAALKRVICTALACLKRGWRSVTD